MGSVVKGRMFVGTSGWHYAHWRGPFYPPDLPPAKFLEFYRRHLASVEINNSFYKLPEKTALAQWRRSVPEGFVFAVKASRFITHMKKLKDPETAFEKFFERIKVLEDKLGPVLLQLPPRWSPHPERLDAFLSSLPRGLRCAFEFRDPSWFIPEVDEVLRRRRAAFCIYEFERRTSPLTITADFVYVRLHGPDGRYQGLYGESGLRPWAERCREWARSELDVYCYFDNDQAGYAVRDAILLDGMLRAVRTAGH